MINFCKSSKFIAETLSLQICSLNLQNSQFLIIILALTLISADLASSQSDCSINLGSSLPAESNTPPWLSPSGEFAFGFRPLPPSAEGENLFLLSIWYNKIPEQTIVWSKNAQPVPERSRIDLTRDGNFVLYNPEGQEIWRAQTGNNQRSTCAAILDSGNLVLINRESNYIWQSFDIPTDTIMPGQRIRMGGNLTSRQSEANYTDGRFQLRLQRDGNLVLYTIFLPTEDVNGAYWSSRTQRANSDSWLVFDENGFLYIQEGNENVFNVTKRDMGLRSDFYHMARIDFDGVFRHYNHPRRNYAGDATGCGSAWSMVQTTPENMCTAIMDNLGSGACGYNSYCVNSNGRPSCFCPEGYSPLDPLDLNRGCKPDFQLPRCQQGGWESNIDFVEFKELNNTDWPLTDYELQTGSQVDKETCKEFCLRDCFCAAAIYNGNSCWKKKFPLANGRQSRNLNKTALLKVPRDNATSVGPERGDQSTVVLVVSVLLGSSVFVNFMLMVCIAAGIFFVYRKKLLNLELASNVYGARRYTYKELEEATGGFKTQVGRGSFGSVYKGVISSIPKRYIAVKKLDKVEKEGEREFSTEVSAIGRTHHKNLVALLGYCDEGPNRLLVLEYMSNGSLAGFLFGLSRPHWNQRMQIAFGIARGLTYLHEECSSQIIHCDVKPQNILLDDSFIPKISDFGLAKLLLSEQSRAARTHIRGTIGYFAPEWFRKASITVKVDVYSFGVMLLEMICCTSSVEFAMGGDEEEALVDWVYECYSKRKLEKLVENDEEARNDIKSVEKLVMVAIWCIQDDPSLRPSMRRVAQMLEGIAEVSVPPRPSAFDSN